MHCHASRRSACTGAAAAAARAEVAGALVAEASMRALSIDTIEICPWALREGLILRKLDTESDSDLVVRST